MTIQELVELAKQKDPGALSTLYNDFFQRIFRFIFLRVSHKETAEDLTEDVFIKAFEAIAKLEDPKLFQSWIYQIAKNKIIDHYRKSKVDIALEEVEDILEYRDEIGFKIDNDVAKSKIIETLNLLSKEQKQVISLKFFEDLDNTTIAKLLGKNEGTIRVIQHRALIRLKELINDPGNI